MNILNPQFYSTVPIGTIIIWAGQIPQPAANNPQGYDPTLTDGWMICDGRVLECKDNFALWTVLGDLYNTSAGKNQFQLPNFQGYFLRTVDNQSPVSSKIDQDDRTPAPGDSSSLVGTTQDSAFQSHTHNYTEPAQATTSGSKKGPAVPSVTPNTPTAAPEVKNLSKPGGKTQTDPVSTFETRPTNISVYYLIKAM